MKKQTINYKHTLIWNIPDEYKNTSGIYIISNNINTQIYIGRSINLYKRYLKHDYALKHEGENFKFKLLCIKYPEIIFTMSLIEITNDIKEREKHYISKYNSINMGLNIIPDDDFNNENRHQQVINSKEYKEYRKLKLSLSKHKQEKSQTESVNINKQPLIPVYIINENTDLHSPKISKLIESFGFAMTKNSFYIRDETTNKLKNCRKKQFIKACQQKELESKILI